MRQLLISWGVALGVAWAAFVPPADGPVPFRRDKLPVTVQTMRQVSSQLETMARASAQTQVPARLRLTAQTLAVAIALDPENHAARALAIQLAGEKIPDPPAPGEVQRALASTRNIHSWLTEPEAGDEGHRLAACLGDILAGFEPQDPAAHAHGAAEQGKWAEWVAEAAQFQAAEEPPKPEEQLAETPPSEPAASEPAATEDAESPAELRLKEGSLRTLLWKFNPGNSTSSLALIPITMKAWRDGEGSEPQIALTGEQFEPISKKVALIVSAALKERHHRFVPGLNFHFSVPEDFIYSQSRNGLAITTPVCLLADAALSGELPKTLAIGSLDENGAFNPVPLQWEILRYLHDSPVKRAILPASSLDTLPYLLTLDWTQLFLGTEILVAQNARELVAYASPRPAPALHQASSAFAEIQQAQENRSIGSFLGFDSTKQRLSAVLEFFPAHASARMLALRGTSRWPRALPRAAYAREIRSSLEPIGQVLFGPWNEKITPERIDEAVVQTRTQLTACERYNEQVADRTELYAAAWKVTRSMNSLSTTIKRATEPSMIPGAIRPVYAEYVHMIRTLTDAVADGYPQPKERE